MCGSVCIYVCIYGVCGICVWYACVCMCKGYMTKEERRVNTVLTPIGQMNKASKILNC